MAAYIALISISLVFFSHLALLKGANAEFVCTAAGKFAFEWDPRKYYECSFVGGKYTQLLHDCPPDNCFDIPKVACQLEECNRGDSTATGKPTTAFKCAATGKYPHEDATRKGAYYQCNAGTDGQFYVFEYQCLPTIPCFDAKTQKCQAC